MQQEHQKKIAQVKLDVNLVEQAEQLVNLAQTKINMAIADQKEAEANVGKYQAEVVRWDSELKRMTQMVAEKIVDSQALDETRKEFESSKSAWEAAEAAVAARKAAKLFAEADLGKARIDVKTAKAQVEVSEAEERRLAALLEYTKITAPYDGVVTSRNANTGDYVESVSGDKAASGSVPMFVVAQTDLVRIFVDVPEQFARYVQAGNEGGRLRRRPQRAGHSGDGHPHRLVPEPEDPLAAGRDRSAGRASSASGRGCTCTPRCLWNARPSAPCRKTP